MAAWVRFTEEFIYTPSQKPSISIRYKKGKRFMVTEECARIAIAKGKAEAINKEEGDKTPKGVSKRPLRRTLRTAPRAVATVTDMQQHAGNLEEPAQDAELNDASPGLVSRIQSSHE